MTVHGYATINQIYLSVARPSLKNCNDFINYSSIAALSADYLNVSNSLHAFTNDYDNIPKSVQRKLKKDGWVIIVYSVRKILRYTNHFKFIFVSRIYFQQFWI